jgi:hypothetical protein
MKTTKIRITLDEEMLGMTPSSPDIHEKFIASRGPNAQTLEEEIATHGEEEVIEQGMTVFPRDEQGRPILWDYQIKGMFKDSCGMLSRAKGTKSSQLKAYKKIIDGLVFVSPRQIPCLLPDGGKIGSCQRPLRAQTAKGERVSLAHSETVPAGTIIEFEVTIWDLAGEKKADLQACIIEWLEYGVLRGLGQWRNSGKGRFHFEIVE